MRTSRRGLTVIELVLILLVIGIVVFFLLRMRGRDGDTAGTAGTAADTAGALAKQPDLIAPAPLGAGGALAAHLALTQEVDSVAGAGDTLTVRLRATTDANAGVANALVRFAADGGGSVQPDSAVTDDLGEVQVRWTLGTAATQVLRATVPGGPAEPLETRVRVGGGR